MRVHVDQAGDHGLGGRVHDGARVQLVAMTLDAANDAVFDHDVRFAAERIHRSVQHMAGVDHDAAGCRGRFPGEVERDRIGKAAVGQDAAQAIRRLINDVA